MSHVVASCLVPQGEERGMLEARLVPHVTAEAPNLSGESDEDEPFIADSLEDMKGKRLGECAWLTTAVAALLAHSWLLVNAAQVSQYLLTLPRVCPNA